MQKVDITIAVVGVVALLATGLGVAFYDDINNLTEYTVEDEMVALTGSGSGASDVIELDVPDNMIHAMMDVTVNFGSANPAASCTVNVAITVTGPDGQEATFDGSAPISSGSLTIAVESVKFGEVPGDFLGDADDREANTLTWDTPLSISVVQEDTGCGAPVLGVGGATYGAIDVTGNWHGYSIHDETPDPGAL